MSSIMAQLFAVTSLLLLGSAAAADCTPHQLNGTWVDRSGNVATVSIGGGGSIAAHSLYGATGWRDAAGALSPQGDALWMVFSGRNISATTATNCSLIVFDNGSIWGFAGTESVVKNVHYVFMTHLDVSFTALGRDVCQLYFDQWLPQSAALSQTMRARGGAAQFALTSHPFLVSEFLDNAMQCARTPPNVSAIAAMREAISRGDIRWHGKWGNLFPELMDAGGFAASLGLATALNSQFGTAWGATAVKSTDVPGLSRSVIPVLAAAGRQGLHMGYNSACRMAGIPGAFRWVHPESGVEILALANNNYGSSIVVPPHALVFKYQTDNSGPPTPAEVDAFVAGLSTFFPGAAVNLSSLDAFVQAVVASPSYSALPVITSEIGDSWLYGSPADPHKLAVFRETSRAIAEATGSGALPHDDHNLVAFERRIAVAGPEHNWGLSLGQYLPGARTPQGNWSNAAFNAVRGRPDYAFIESGWAEKRGFLTPLAPTAPVAPAWSSFLASLAARLAALAPTRPDVSPQSGFSPVQDPSVEQRCGRLSVAFNATSGAVASLRDVSSGHEWVLRGSTGLLEFTYRTYTEAHFDAFNREYNPGCGPPCGDFAKPGMSSASPLSAEWPPSLAALHLRQGPVVGGDAPACTFVASLALPELAVGAYGGMQEIYVALAVDINASSAAPLLHVNVTWFNKTATRLAEATLLSFRANTTGAGGGAAGRWRMDVLGHDVFPDDVVVNGTRFVHGVWSGFGIAPEAGQRGLRYRVDTLDAPLVTLDSDHLLHYDGTAAPDVTGNGGFRVNLHNNLWGTAFPAWYADDALFRFHVELDPGSP